jgi:GxxExxY protein
MIIYRTPLAEAVIGCAIDVHKALGPGLMESAYEHCLTHELTIRHIKFARQVPVPVSYRGATLDCAYRADLIVEGQLLLELKAIDGWLPIHKAQVLTYLKLLGLRHGLLMNFNCRKLVDGLQSVVLPEAPISEGERSSP